MYFAYKCGYQDIIDEEVKSGNEWFSKYGVKPHARGGISSACEYDDVETVKHFVKLYDLKIKDYETFIYDAALSGSINVVKHLINNGANINVRDAGGDRKCVAFEARRFYRRMLDDIYSGEIKNTGYESMSELKDDFKKLKIVVEYLWELTEKDFPEELK